MQNLLREFFSNKKVFITGHTGFKGAWLYALLELLGAEVYGFALAASSEADLSNLLGINNKSENFIDNICNYSSLERAILAVKPDVIFHLAAQSLVLKSYQNPLETFQVNVLGTLNLLEILRRNGLKPIVVNVTTDKCYSNSDSGKPFQETDPLGGNDPYSASKAMVEILSNSYYQSFFKSREHQVYKDEAGAGIINMQQSLRIATVRAGNVIGGGDWNENRIIPDLVRSLAKSEQICLRNPSAVRPWQFVLEPVYAYCILAYKLSLSEEYCSAWNIGPEQESCVSVSRLTELFLQDWGSGSYRVDDTYIKPKESKLLLLDSSKAKSILAWKPVLTIDQAVSMTAEWYRKFLDKKLEIREFTYSQIREFLTLYDSYR